MISRYSPHIGERSPNTKGRGHSITDEHQGQRLMCHLRTMSKGGSPRSWEQTILNSMFGSSDEISNFGESDDCLPSMVVTEQPILPIFSDYRPAQFDAFTFEYYEWLSTRCPILARHRRIPYNTRRLLYSLFRLCDTYIH